ncbi:MAG: hypothetical protein ACLFN5_06725, partial [bacterium]
HNQQVDRYQLANSCIGVIAQRLVRLIDESCKVEDQPSKDQLRRLNLSEDQTYYRPQTPSDQISGYKGMTGIFQILPMTDELRLCILNDAPYSEYQSAAHKVKLPSLREKGVQKVIAGSTSIDEVLRVTFREDLVSTLSISS